MQRIFEKLAGFHFEMNKIEITYHFFLAKFFFLTIGTPQASGDGYRFCKYLLGLNCSKFFFDVLIYRDAKFFLRVVM